MNGTAVDGNNWLNNFICCSDALLCARNILESEGDLRATRDEDADWTLDALCAFAIASQSTAAAPAGVQGRSVALSATPVAFLADPVGSWCMVMTHADPPSLNDYIARCRPAQSNQQMSAMSGSGDNQDFNGLDWLVCKYSNWLSELARHEEAEVYERALVHIK